ncbi:MAG: putative type IX sorting system protein PorV2 [Bacteroidia bacterium]
MKIWMRMGFWVGLVWAQAKYSNEFLKIGVGARSAGLGNAVVSNAYDATASYWNPAALVEVPFPQFHFMHSEYFAGIAKYDYGALAMPLRENQRLGISFLRLGIDNIPNTLKFYDGATYDFSRITEFSVADMALLLSYAKPLRQGLGIGASLKIIHRQLGPFATAWGFGLDVGIAYHKGPWQFGATAYDLTNTFNAWTFNTETFEEAFRLTGNEIPQNSIEWTRPSARAGIAYQIRKDKKLGFMPSLEMSLYTDGARNTLLYSRLGSMDLSAGLEVRYEKYVFLRVGATQFQRLRTWDGRRYLSLYPTAGIGIAFKALQIDYALANFTGFQMGMYSHLISAQVTLTPELRSWLKR